MRRRLLVVILVVVAIAFFFFIPWGKTIAANFSGGGQDYVGWVSPSFALFQCGVAIGNYPVQVPYGTFVNSGGSSFWNCEYPRL